MPKKFLYHSKCRFVRLTSTQRLSFELGEKDDYILLSSRYWKYGHANRRSYCIPQVTGAFFK